MGLRPCRRPVFFEGHTMTLADLAGLIKVAGVQWSHDKAPRMGAALAFYMSFSLAPLLLISIALAGMVFGEEAARGQIISQVQGLIGREGGAVLQSMLAQTNHPECSLAATIMGVALL